MATARGGDYRTLAGILLIPILIVAAFIVISQTTTVRFNQLSSDPASIGRMPFYSGALSNLGVLCWAAGASVCLFAACLLRGTPQARFFLHAGLLTTLLLLDDLFLLHDEVFPVYLGVRERLVHLTLMAFTAGFLFYHRRYILSGDFLWLGTALLLFACSVAADGFIGSSIVNKPGEFMIEDCPKFVGIFMWSAFYIRTARRDLALRLAPAPITPAEAADARPAAASRPEPARNRDSMVFEDDEITEPTTAP